MDRRFFVFRDYARYTYSSYRTVPLQHIYYIHISILQIQLKRMILLFTTNLDTHP